MIPGNSVGGDPESCTSCVEIESMHIPLCSTSGAQLLGDSKCSALGIGSNSGLPREWFDPTQRDIGHYLTCTDSSEAMALRYCAGITDPQKSFFGPRNDV